MDKQAQWHNFLMQLSTLNEQDKQDLDEMFPNLVSHKIILITGLPRSGKTLFIRQISHNQAQQTVSINPFITNWFVKNGNQTVMYYEAPFNQSLPEMIRLQFSHIDEHYHLERMENANIAMVYRCREVGLLEDKIFQEKLELKG